MDLIHVSSRLLRVLRLIKPAFMDWDGRYCSGADRDKFGAGDDASMSKPMTVGAEDNAVVKCLLPLFRLRNNVVAVARSFVPSASHAGVTKHFVESPCPTRLRRVNTLRCSDKAPPMVPWLASKMEWFEIDCGMTFLTLAWDSISVAANEPPRTPALVDFFDQSAASTSALNQGDIHH